MQTAFLLKLNAKGEPPLSGCRNEGKRHKTETQNKCQNK